MQPELLFTKIEMLLPILRIFQLKGTAQMDVDKKLLLQEVYLHLQPGTQISLSCNTCLIHYLHVIHAFFEREHPKFLESKKLNEIKEVEEVKEIKQDEPSKEVKQVEEVKEIKEPVVKEVGPAPAKKRPGRKKR